MKLIMDNTNPDQATPIELLMQNLTSNTMGKPKVLSENMLSKL